MRPFRDLADFLRRTRAELPAAESLIRVGALDGLGVTDAGRPPTRDELLALLPELKAVLAREGVAGDDTLVPRARADASARGPDARQRLERGAAALGGARAHGALAHRHPLALAAARPRSARRHVGARPARAARTARRVRVVGVRERAQTPRTRSGKRTCFLTLEDPTGLLDVVVFSDVLDTSGETIVKHRAYLVDGMLQNNCERGLAIVADVVKPYVVRTGAGDPVRLRRGVPSGPMGPALGGAGAPEEESWEAAEAALAAEERAEYGVAPSVRCTHWRLSQDRRRRRAGCVARRLQLAAEPDRTVAELLAHRIEPRTSSSRAAASAGLQLVRRLGLAEQVELHGLVVEARDTDAEQPQPDARRPRLAHQLARDRAEHGLVVGGQRRGCAEPSSS